MRLANRQTDSVVILGASGRAAAESAARAGLRAVVYDQFGDLDTRAVADWRPLDECDPSRLGGDSAGVLFVGGMESRPDLHAMLRSCRGVPPARFPARRETTSWLREMPRLAAAAGLCWPDSVALTAERGGDPTKPAEPCLFKRLDSAGGLSVGFSPPDEAARAAGHWICQEFIRGQPLSGGLLITRDNVQLLGMARPIRAESDAQCETFIYRGSIVIGQSSEDLSTKLLCLGAALRDRYQLRGLVGVDLIHAQHRDWLLEINARYTASMELYEETRSLVAAHFLAVRGETVQTVPSRTVGGKRIVMAPRELEISSPLPKTISIQADAEVSVHDRPLTPRRLRRGEPICTLKERQAAGDLCERRLLLAEEKLQRSLVGNSREG